MPKQPTNTSKPTVATLPRAGVSARLGDYLKQPGLSTKPPARGGRSTGGIPTNKPRGGKR